jgi:hypothetical protein
MGLIMSTSLKLLINSLLLCSTLAIAEVESNVSGFVYSTIFSNNEWQNNKTVGALNLDLMSDHIRGTLQVGTEEKSHIRRAAIEISYPINGNNTGYLTIGRFPRLDSFYNNATDNPASSGMAILPFAGYNYKFQTGTFVTLDGVEAKGTYLTKNSDLITYRASSGRMYVDNEKQMNEYFFGKYQDGVDITIPNSSFDYSIHYESEHIHLYYSKNHYEANTKAINQDAVSKYLAYTFSNLNYDVDKFGAKYQTINWWIQGEYVHGITNLYAVNNLVSYHQESNDYYGSFGFYLGDNYSIYAGMSTGRGIDTKGEKSVKDQFIGITRETGVYAVSLDYHHGHGRPWVKFNSQITSWNALVASGTYRF